MKPIAFRLAVAAIVVGHPVNAADPSPYPASAPGAKVNQRPETRLLGMVLVDPTGQEMEQYQMESPLPLVAQLKDPAFFPKGMEPTRGCAFWIIEPPANGFWFNHQNNAGRCYPKTVRELVQAIIACTISPEAYQKLWQQADRALKEHAESLEDKPKEQECLLKVAGLKMPPDEVGKYICRVVYKYPGRRGTMTTQIHMARHDLEQLRALLKN